MSDSQPHAMHLSHSHASGAEEWHCPTCSRRLLVWRLPTYQKVVLHAGDERAIHSGGSGGALAQVQSATSDDAALAEGLRPWLKWFTHLDSRPF